jgi:predicted regulator of Ras-like GTPase activity (Roadblock/LC7/MglB family)
MNDLTAVKGVLGFAVFANDTLVEGEGKGRLGDKTGEIEQFWVNAASVMANNFKLGQVREVTVAGPDRQVLMLLAGDKTVVCEVDPTADWKALAAEIRRKL